MSVDRRDSLSCFQKPVCLSTARTVLVLGGALGKVLLIALWVALVSACQAEKPQSTQSLPDKQSMTDQLSSVPNIQSAPDAQAMTQVDHSLSWLAAGAQVLVDKRWIFTVSSKAFTELSLPESVRKPSTQTRWQVSASPNARRWFWFDNQHTLNIKMDKPAKPLTVDIPNWLSKASQATNAEQTKQTANENPDSDPPFNTVAWLNNQHIFVQQTLYQQPDQQACAILNAADGQFSPSTCLQSTFYLLSKISHLSANIFALYSSAEGVNGLDIVQFKPGADTVQRTLGSLSFFADVPLQVTLNATSGANTSGANIVFPCRLNTAEHIRCEPTRSQWSVYQWRFDANEQLKISPSAITISQGKYLAPHNSKLAWIENNRLCIEDINNMATDCTPLP